MSKYNPNLGGALYIAVDGNGDFDPQNTDLNQVGYEALTWLQVKGVGSHGETGSTPNILNYDTWDDVVMQKSEGVINAGDPEIELGRIASDPGQIQLRVAASTANRNQNAAFKIVKPDGTIMYNRGIVTGPRHPHGRAEDFILEIFTAGLNQEQIVVNP